jgi:myo-inositol-1(or 4)-monophosphatase
MRRTGSAAIDLCYTACGRLDGFWEMKLKPWDVSGGFIIVEKAGGLITDYTGKRWNINSDRVIAANPKLHAEMLKIIVNNEKQ